MVMLFPVGWAIFLASGLVPAFAEGDERSGSAGGVVRPAGPLTDSGCGSGAADPGPG